MAGEQARTASESQAQGTADATARIRKLGRAAEPYVIAQRRYFHQHPELSLQEVGTTEAIARELDESREERLEFMQHAVKRIRGLLAKNGIRADVSGRPKHIYSIWKKMQRKLT